MKHRIFTSLFFALLLSFALMLVLVSCGGEPGGTVSPLVPSRQPEGGEPSQVQPSDPQPASAPVGYTPGEPVQPSAPPAESPAVQSPAQSPDAPQVPIDQPAAPKAMTMEETYRFALEGIYRDHLYPNGDEVDVPEWADMESNSFAIFDVDGDGVDELLYENVDSTMVGMNTYVFRFDEECSRLGLDLELWGSFVGGTFYDNGVVTIPASHNQGLGQMEGFWPFFLYQYDPGSDGYLMVAYVDGWDGTFFPDDHEGHTFPDDIDEDGDKVVYILTVPGPEVTDTTIDGPAYEEWLDSYLAGASPLELPWKNMTLENIQAVAP